MLNYSEKKPGIIDLFREKANAATYSLRMPLAVKDLEGHMDTDQADKILRKTFGEKTLALSQEKMIRTLLRFLRTADLNALINYSVPLVRRLAVTEFVGRTPAQREKETRDSNPYTNPAVRTNDSYRDPVGFVEGEAGFSNKTIGRPELNPFKKSR